jgi:hypothetical protein
MGTDVKSLGAGAWLKIIVGTLYVGIGISIILKPQLLGFLQGGYKTAFAVLLIAYGVFRIYRTLRVPNE